MKVIKMLFLIITSPIWVPFWILWKILKIFSKLGIGVKCNDGWGK